MLYRLVFAALTDYRRTFLKYGGGVATVQSLQIFLDELLLANQFNDDQNGIYVPSSRPVNRLGLALEPSPNISSWINDNDLDALFLHRPWKLERLPNGIGVLAYHYAFDERLTTAYNPPLAEALGMTGLEPFGLKQGRVLGMMGDVPQSPWAVFRERAETEFGGLEGVHGTEGADVTRICVVGALRPALVYDAAEQGARVYLTGEYRPAAARAVAETGMSVFVIGHERSEVWGLRALERLLQKQFPNLETFLQTPQR